MAQAIAVGRNLVITDVDEKTNIVKCELHLSDLGPTKKTQRGEGDNHLFVSTGGNKPLPVFGKLSIGVNVYGPADSLGG